MYSHRTILQMEAAGFQVIPGLLNTFCLARQSPSRSSSKRIPGLIPDEYAWNLRRNAYEAAMGITTYVDEMTDTFAVELYRNL